MNKINPIKLVGEWKEGFAIDYHTIYSTYLGEDEWGRSQFDTKRSGIGQLVYELKYRGDKSKVGEILTLISPFLDKWQISNKIDYIIPTPPSKVRAFQPVFEICQGISQYIDKQALLGVVEKKGTTQSKNLSLEQKTEITGTITRKMRFRNKVNLLIVDDLYQTGKTLNEITRALKKDSNVNDVYILTMTKTRR